MVNLYIHALVQKMNLPKLKYPRTMYVGVYVQVIDLKKKKY